MTVKVTTEEVTDLRRLGYRPEATEEVESNRIRSAGPSCACRPARSCTVMTGWDWAGPGEGFCSTAAATTCTTATNGRPPRYSNSPRQEP